MNAYLLLVHSFFDFPLLSGGRVDISSLTFLKLLIASFRAVMLHVQLTLICGQL